MTPDHNAAGHGAAGHSAANLSVTRYGHGASGKFIEAVDLSLSFGSTPALRGASLGVAKGEIVAVMGPSGSGKSTLLHCLAGILVPSSGEVHFNGMRLDRLSDDKRSALRRDRFGFVFQSGQLVPELTAEENVALPLLLSGMRRGPAMAAARTWFPRSGWTGSSPGGPVSCPAGRRSASPLPAAWSPSPKCCSPTSRPGRWTRCPASW